MAREIGADDVVARSLCSIGTAQAELGSHETGMANVRESLRLAQASGDEDQIARIYQNLAWVARFGFELAEAHAQYEEAEQFSFERDLNGHRCASSAEITVKVRDGALGRRSRPGRRPALRPQHRPGEPDRAAAQPSGWSRPGGATPARAWDYLDQAKAFIEKTPEPRLPGVHGADPW